MGCRVNRNIFSSWPHGPPLRRSRPESQVPSPLIALIKRIACGLCTFRNLSYIRLAIRRYPSPTNKHSCCSPALRSGLLSFHHNGTKPNGRYYCKASKWHPAAALIESARPPATPAELKFVRCSGSRGEAIAWIRRFSWAVRAATDSMLVGRKGYHAVPAKQDTADPPLSLRIIHSPFVRYTRTVCRTPWLM